MKQPNAWSCFPTCVSILTGIPFDTLIRTIGHDGSKIIYPEEITAKRYECFNLSEMSITLLKLAWAVTRFAANLEHLTRDRVTNYPDMPSISKLLVKLQLPVIISIKKGNTMHCLAYKPIEGVYVDPLVGIEERLIYSSPLEIIDFVILTKIQR